MLRKTLLVAALVGWLLSTQYPWAVEHVSCVLRDPWHPGPSSLTLTLEPGWDELQLEFPVVDLGLDAPILWIIALGASTTALLSWGVFGLNSRALALGAGLQLLPMLLLGLAFSPRVGSDLELRTGAWLAIASTAFCSGIVGHFFIDQGSGRFEAARNGFK